METKTCKHPLQQAALEQLRRELPDHLNLTAWLREILEIDDSNIYRRVRGEKELSHHEIHQICEALPAARTLFLPKKEAAVLNARLATFHDWNSMYDYYSSLLKTLRGALKKDHCLRYLGRDLPLFFFSAAPNLLRYKMTVWAKCAGFADFQNPPKSLVELGLEMFRVYQDLNTEEIWYLYGVYNQMEQLKHWREMDYLTETEFSVIQNEIRETFENYQKQAAAGQKESGKFVLHTTDFCIMTNAGFLRCEDLQVLMNSFQGVHFMDTCDPAAIGVFQNHWEAQMGMSRQVSQSNEMWRRSFFGKIEERLEALAG